MSVIPYVLTMIFWLMRHFFYQELIVMFEVRLPNKCFKSVVLAMDSRTESSFCMNTRTGGETDSSNLYNAVVQRSSVLLLGPNLDHAN